MVDAHEPAGLTTNSDGMRGLENRPDNDEDLLHYLLPLPVGSGDAGGGGGATAAAGRMDEDAVRKMMAMRNAMFDTE